jgi:hypothetical protein
MKQTVRYYDNDYDQQEEEAGDDLVGDHNDPEVADEIAPLTSSVILCRPDCVVDKVAEQREQMMLDAAEHIKMSRAQCQLYQDKVDRAIWSVDKIHSKGTYIFVVDYGQNNYFSPMKVNNLGMVDHAHKYPDGLVSKHMHCHVCTDAVWKKGANNVASLIMKTLRHLDLFKQTTTGSELNIVFDNCCGQNKNNTVLRLAAWIAKLRYFN